MSHVERLIEFNEVERHYSYAILEAPFPVVGYLATIRVHSIDDDPSSAEVQWFGRFTPEGATDAETVDLFTGIFSNGLEALDTALG